MRTDARVLMTVLVCVNGAAVAQSTLSEIYRAELLNDASTRTSLLADPGKAGHDGSNFYLSDASGNNKLTVGGLLQMRLMANSRNDPADGSEDFTVGGQSRRTWLVLGGNLGSKDLTFRVQSEFNRNGGAASLLDAWARYKFNDRWSATFGQFKVPLLAEELISATQTLAADYSLTNVIFSQARSQAVQIEYADDSFRVRGALSDGLNTLNTDFNSTSEADFGVTARGEFMFGPGKDWKVFRDFTSPRGRKFAGLFGVAGHYQSGGDTGYTPDMELFEYTADLQLEGNGWSAFAAFIGRRIETSGGPEFDDFGIVVQGGYYLTSDWEAFARFDMIIPDDDRPGGTDEFKTITAGVNHYIFPESHAAKLTADVQYFLDSTTGSSALVSPATNVGLLGDADEGQAVFRLQFQIVF